MNARSEEPEHQVHPLEIELLTASAAIATRRPRFSAREGHSQTPGYKYLW